VAQENPVFQQLYHKAQISTICSSSIVMTDGEIDGRRGLTPAMAFWCQFAKALNRQRKDWLLPAGHNLEGGGIRTPLNARPPTALRRSRLWESSSDRTLRALAIARVDRRTIAHPVLAPATPTDRHLGKVMNAFNLLAN
jgi:hypothetical protein